jgi:hypothetical protein
MNRNRYLFQRGGFQKIKHSSARESLPHVQVFTWDLLKLSHQYLRATLKHDSIKDQNKLLSAHLRGLSNRLGC